jgi:hypothetical protein
MDVDYYDDPQPESFWAGVSDEDLKNDLALFGKIIAGPVALFALVSVFNHLMNKKWNSL